MFQPQRVLLGIPVYNEQKYVTQVLGEVLRYAQDVLVIDDGSTDDTPLLLAGAQPRNCVQYWRARDRKRRVEFPV